MTAAPVSKVSMRANRKKEAKLKQRGQDFIPLLFTLWAQVQSQRLSAKAVISAIKTPPSCISIQKGCACLEKANHECISMTEAQKLCIHIIYYFKIKHFSHGTRFENNKPSRRELVIPY